MPRIWFVGLGLVGTIAGCNVVEAVKPPSPSTSPKNSEPVTIQSVTDGDTVRLIDGRRVRLCGIDAPEKAQPGGMEAKQYLQTLVDRSKGQGYLTEADVDRYGRTVGELFLPSDKPNEEIFVNSEMLQSGNAFLYPQYAGNCPNKGVLEVAQQKARDAKRGVWKSPGFEKPWDYRKRVKQ